MAIPVGIAVRPALSRRSGFALAALALCLFTQCVWTQAPPSPTLREPVHPRRNVDEFPPVQAKFVRFTVLMTNRGEPGLDELEIYTVDEPTRNVALASAGARVTASGSYPGYKIHDLATINDGLYGNGHCWIAHQAVGAWVQVELPAPATIHQVVWGRDREGKFVDRLVTEYRIEVATSTNAWSPVASSADRQPLGAGAELFGPNPSPHQAVPRFAPVSTSLAQAGRTSSAEYTIDVWQSEDGLPSNAITALAQTRNGYLWIATLNGLARFDGARFTVYGERDGLKNPRLLCLCEDDQGALWMGTEGGGLARFYQGAFTHFTTSEGLLHNVVLSLAIDAGGKLWIGTLAGVNCLDGNAVVGTSEGRVRTYGPASRVEVDSNGQVWVLGAQLWRLRDGQLILPAQRDEPAEFSSLFTTHAGRQGRLWYGGANGYVGCLSNETLTVFGTSEGLAPESIWELYESRKGDLWVGTASGGLRRLRDGRFTSITAQEGLSDNSVRCLFEDHEDNVWVGTSSGGLNRLKPRRLITYSTRDGLSHDVITSLAQSPSGELYIGSNCGGLNARTNSDFAPRHLSYLLDNACLWPLLVTRDGALWMGTWGNGLFQHAGGRLVNFLAANGLPDEFVLALCEDAQSGLWIGTYQGGLSHFQDGGFVNYNTAHGLSANWVTALVQEPDGLLWVGTSGGGLNAFHHQRFTTYRREHGLGSDFIRTLYRDDQGTLWIGTGGGGLSWRRDDRFVNVTRADGLPDDVISQILEDNEGFLWCGSNQGIFRISKRELEGFAAGQTLTVHPIAYGKADGMESLECTGGFHPAGLKAQDGTLWFSTVKGLVHVNPADLASNQLPPPVVVEEIWVDGSLRRSPITEPSPLTVGPGRSLEFRYTALSLVAPEKVRFRHRIEGLERDWVEAGPRRVAHYAHLPAGDYRFRVSACNNDGLWNEAGAVVAFAVLPAFWQTWWFRTLAAIVLLGAAGWAVRFLSVRRLRRRLERLERQHALEKERTRIAKDIHDDIGASLTQISFLSQMSHKDQARPELIAARLDRISQTAQDVVQTVDAIVWAVNPRNDSLDNLANYLSRFAEEFFRVSPIRCRLDLPDHLPHYPLTSEARHNLYLAVKESLNNVARHSGASEVWLRVTAENGEFSLIVEDNGQGFSTNGHGAKSSGNGLVNMHKRLEEIGGRCEVQSERGRGVTVRLFVPMAHPAQAP